MIIALIDEAVAAGARQDAACEMLDLSARTVQRWRDDPQGDDARCGPKSKPKHALSAEERQWVIDIANSPQYRNSSIRQIVPDLADRGLYVASESTFYRVLHEEQLMAHRSPTRPTRHHRPRACVATGPGEVWTWDITYLRSARRGTFFYLYLVLDIWSRKIVAWDVHEVESPDLAAALIMRACAAEGIERGRLTLHSDNGGPMKGATMLATLQRLGIVPSFSRPSVSDDNAACEAIFRTMKYRPGYPRDPFASVEAARTWVSDFVAWYNGEHLHSAIKYVTPNDRHARRDVAILAARAALYRQARASTPARWSCDIRDWTPIGDVTLNPERQRPAA